MLKVRPSDQKKGEDRKDPVNREDREKERGYTQQKFGGESVDSSFFLLCPFVA